MLSLMDVKDFFLLQSPGNPCEMNTSYERGAAMGGHDPKWAAALDDSALRSRRFKGFKTICIEIRVICWTLVDTIRLTLENARRELQGNGRDLEKKWA